MNETQRHDEIIAWVNAKRAVSVVNIIDRFQVSAATVRRDITKLDQQGKIKKVRNGIVRIEGQKKTWSPLDKNNTDNYDEKSRIAIEASKLCQNGDSIVLNCGSTAFLLGHELCGRDVQIITNYFPLASYLIEQEHDCVIIIGGQYNKTQSIILNPIPDISSAYTGQWMFTSGRGLTASGLYKTEVLTAVSEQQMLGKIGKLVVVVDSSKVGQHTGSGMLFCPTEKIDIVITGKKADRAIINSLQQQGVDVILV